MLLMLQLLALLLSISLVANQATADPIDADTVFPTIPGANFSAFTQVENDFDPNYGSVLLYWNIESSGRDEVLHGLLVLNASAVDPAYGTGAKSLANSWVALGLGVCMLSGDFIMVHAFPNGTGAEVLWLITTSQYYEAPITNPDTTIVAASTGSLIRYQGNGYIAGEFRRFTSLEESQMTYHQPIDVNATTEFIWSFNLNPKSTPTQPYKVWHTFNRGRYEIQLSTGDPAGPQPTANMPLRYAHGAVMGFTWMLLFPFAIYWARFGKSMPAFNTGWFWIHIVLQITGSALSATFIIVVITTIPDAVNWGSSAVFDQINRPHPIIGFTVLSLIVVQLWLGPLNRLSLSVDSLFPYRPFISGLHRWTGRALLLLAFAQVGLGLQTLFAWPDGPFDGRGGIIYWVVYFVLLGLWAILFAGTELFWLLRVRKADGGFISRRTGRIYGRIPSTSPSPASAGAYEKSASTQPTRGRFGIISGGTRPEDALRPTAAPPAAAPAQENGLSVPMKEYGGGAATAGRSSPAASGAWRQFSWVDIDEALNDGQLYVVAKGRYVYDINQWIYSHPGGQIVLNQVAGTDITNDYFHESGFDASTFVAKRPTPASGGTRHLPTPSMPRSVHGGAGGSGAGSGPSHAPPTIPSQLNIPATADLDLAGVPPLTDDERRLVIKARRTNVHSRLAIEKLSSLMVGVVTESAGMPEGAPAPFSPLEYRRYALIESRIERSGSPSANPVYRQRFCILFPHDMRANEPFAFLPGQCVEIQLRVRNKQYVSRFYTPVSGSPACFEIRVKLEPAGQLTPALVRQKPGDRQIKIRGPFGNPLMHPDSPLPASFTAVGAAGSWAYECLVFVVAGSGLAAALQVVDWLFMPSYTPLLVIQGYQPQSFDEIALAVGDWVIAKEHLYDGWAVGLNIRTGQEGMFPLPITYPRSGTATRMHILNSTSTADRSFGADLLRGALVAHGPYLSVSHLLTREQAAPQEAVDNCPGDVVAGRGRVSTQVLASALWSAKWSEAKLGMRRVVVCGPQGFEGAVYDMLVEQLGVQHSEILMLPPDTYI